MNAPVKLYDFSIRTAITVVLAYLCLIGMFAGVSAGAENPLPYMIIVAVLTISFLLIFWYFVGNPIKLDSDGVHRGKQLILRKNVICTVYYNQRFREMTIQLEDKSRRGTTDSRGKPYAPLAVQATRQNVAKLEAWLGTTLEIPEKPHNLLRK
jgi:hypothetical protein